LLDCILFDNINAVVVSHKHDATTKLLDKVKKYLKYLPQKVPTDYDSKTFIRFTNTGSTFYIETAGQKGALGRGDTIHRLHLSEIPWWQGNVADLVSGAEEAVPDNGIITAESSPLMYGDYLHSLYINAKAGKNNYKPFFFPWFTFEEYQTPLDPGESLQMTPEEHRIAQAHSLTPEQVKWRRNKIKAKNGDFRKFIREYPEDDVSCFLQVARAFFDSIYLVLGGEREDRPPVDARGRNKPYHYIIGADPAEGNPDSDPSAYSVLNLDTATIVKSEAGHWKPDQLADKLVAQGKLFNNAKLVVERNNHGHAVITSLQRVHRYYPLYTHPDNKYGWLSTSSNKTLILDDFEESLRKDSVPGVKQLRIACPEVLKEAADMHYNEKGDIISSDTTHHYDRIMASAIAWACRKSRGLRVFENKVFR